jgi:ribulose bisphosphate carboxylase small subunit
MQHYVRVAGIDESGATDVLKMLHSDDEATTKAQTLFIPKTNGSE